MKNKIKQHIIVCDHCTTQH